MRRTLVSAAAVLMLAGCQTPSTQPAGVAGSNQDSCAPPKCVTVTGSPLPTARPRSGPTGLPDPCQLLTPQDVVQVLATTPARVAPLDALGVRTCTYHVHDDQVAVQLSVWPTDDKDWKTDYDSHTGTSSAPPQFGDAYMNTANPSDIIPVDLIGVRRGNVKIHLQVADSAGLVTVPQLQALMTAILARWDRLT